jgi:hypothetical protein
VEDTEEFAKESQRVLNVDNVGEVSVDIISELVLDSADIDIELDEITIKGIVLIVEERMCDLGTERVHIDVECIDNTLDVLKIVLLESLKLADGAEQIDQFPDTSAEKLEFAENLSLVEVKLTGLGHGLEALLGKDVLFDVGILKFLAALEDGDELIMGVLVLVPETIVLESG